MERVSVWMAEELCGGRVEEAEVLDVGTGNGLMLIELARVGFRRLTGTDYVAAAVVLSRANVAAACREDGEIGRLMLSDEDRGRLSVEVMILHVWLYHFHSRHHFRE